MSIKSVSKSDIDSDLIKGAKNEIGEARKSNHRCGNFKRRNPAKEQNVSFGTRVSNL